MRCILVEIVTDSLVGGYALVRFANYGQSVKPVHTLEFEMRKDKAIALADRLRMGESVTVFADSVNHGGVLDFSALIEK